MTGVVLDLFAGPGGWDEGARPLGLRPVGIEWDDAACRTGKAAGHTRVRADVAALPTEPMRGKVTGLIASPPCQDWSVAGAKSKGDGKTGHLVSEVWRYASDLRPEWIACEQVPAVVELWEDYAFRLRHLGYSTWHGVVDAADYGLPQSRERAILLASRVREVVPPSPTHAQHAEPDGLFGPGRHQWNGWGDALSLRGAMEHPRGAGMVERYGDRPRRRSEAPALTLTGKARSWLLHLDSGGSVRMDVRQASILQSFPADYPWHGSRSAVFQQIGNAVPPLLATHVLAGVSGRPSWAVAA